MVIPIDSLNSLRRVAECCHDATFDTDKIIYDRDTQTVSLVLTREMWEKAKKERTILFWHRWKIPKVESILTFYNVVDADIHISDIQDFIVGIDYNAQENIVTLNCMIGTKLLLKVQGLKGTLEDIGEEYFNGTSFTSLGFKAQCKRIAKLDCHVSTPMITYDKSADAVYIYLAHTIAPGMVKKTCPCDALETGVQVNLDFDDSGRILGIEILDASIRLPKEILAEAKIIG